VLSNKSYPSALGTHMILHYATTLISVLFLITSCMSETQQYEEIMATEPTSQYEYKVGLGYGFLNKAVRVSIDGREVIYVVGTDEIEQYAQLQGTKIIASGLSTKKDIMVRVTIDDGQPYEQAIDLSDGAFIHVYHEQAGLHIYNTRYLVLE